MFFLSTVGLSEEGARINFQGQRDFNNISGFLSKSKSPFTIVNNQRIKRGNGSFITLQINGYMTTCGKTDVTLGFFGGELAWIYLKNISVGVDVTICSKKEFNKYKSDNSDTQMSVEVKERKILYSDPVISAKMKKWIETWS